MHLHATSEVERACLLRIGVHEEIICRMVYGAHDSYGANGYGPTPDAAMAACINARIRRDGGLPIHE